MGGYSMRSLQMEPGACAKDVSKIYKLMAEVGLDPQAVKDCVSNSGGTKADKANTLLEQQISQQIDEDAFMKPTVIVNGARYRGNLDCSNPTKSATTCGLLVAICSGFAAGSAPSICQASSAAAKRAAAAIEKGNTVTTLTPPLDARGQPTAHKWTVGTLATPAAKHDVVLQLASPQKLVDHFAKSFIECRPSLFGIPAYGGSVSGSLVYGSPANRNGCKPFATATWPKGRAIIVMADRGGCEFIVKVRNAQRAGAAAAIIADNEPGLLIYPGASSPTSDIAIPSVAIRKADAEGIRRFLCSGAFDAACPKGAAYDKHPASLNIFWSMPHASDKVDWEVWTSSVGSGSIAHNSSIGFEKQFAVAAMALGPSARLAVHYLILPGLRFKCAPHYGTADCSKLCSNGGRYCAADPDGDTKAGLDGLDVVTENLRQACVFNVTTAKKQQNRWWRYVELFNAECKRGIGATWEYRCKDKPATITKLLADAGVDAKAVQKCMDGSGGLTNDAPNAIFEAEMAAKRDDGVRDLRLTTVIVNGVRYRGGLACPNPHDPTTCGVLSAICAGFAKSTVPAVCGGGLASYKYRLFGGTLSEAESAAETAAAAARGKKLKPQPGAATWAEAEKTCNAHGGHLAKIRSVTDNDRVYATCEAARCWIGLNDKKTEGEFTWSDGTSAGAYQLWAKGEPNNGGYGSPGAWVDSPQDEDCGYMHGQNYAEEDKQRRWGDHVCGQALPFVCELPVDYVQVPSPKSWVEAEAYCNTIGGNLASVLSYADNIKVQGACDARGGRCWIGLNDLGIPGEYVWAGRGTGSGHGGKHPAKAVVAATTAAPLPDEPAWDDDYLAWAGDEGWLDPKALGKGFTRWASGEPSGKSTGTDERCVYMHGNRYTPANRVGHWGDHACSMKMPSVCEVGSAAQRSARAEASVSQSRCPAANPPPPPPPRAAVPSPPTLPLQVRARFAYRFFEEPEDWLSAEMSCVKLGGHLATVESFGDNRRAWSFCDAWRCWIGLNDRGREGEFVWTDGRKLGKSFDGESKSAATSAVAAARSD
jgi:hypothetical protein